MHRWLILLLAFQSASAASDLMISREFSIRDQQRTVRSVTPFEEYSEAVLNQKRPSRNPHILADVVWVDRNHELAVAENVAIAPDGTGILAGWWLNHERFSAYVSAGLETPFWRYPVETPWTMPVDAAVAYYAGTGAQLAAFVWGNDSPLPVVEIQPPSRFNNAGVSFSGDGRLVAIVSALDADNGLLTIYDRDAGDTLYTRPFFPARGLYGVDVSFDGTVVVVSCYDQLYVYDIPAGNLRDALYNYSQGTARASSDGSLVTIGTFNGAVYLYAWDGSSYHSRWIRSTGDDWVTAIDISTDGSTVVCGTLDFENNQIAGGKFMMWDAAGGDVLIDYDEYGDMVASVALSADGQYAIAGSWGQYGATFGDVVTCFIRGSDVPIFQLLDDIDEPGSIFSVAISNSGNNAAAGGKAVHARELGNGGMVYSIRIRDRLTNDIAVASIDEPGEFVMPGESVVPTATYINVGTSSASFTATCEIVDIDSDQVVYTSTADIADLPPLSTSQVFFSPDFSMPGDGAFRMMVRGEMNGDQDTSNNVLSLVLRSWHDLRAASVSSPFDNVTLNWPCIPIATFKNLGSYSETVDILLSIRDSTGAEVFAGIVTIFDLAPYSQEEVQFDGWSPPELGSYRAVFTADLQDDRFPDDNVIFKEFRVVEEMLYDDGACDAAYWVDSYPSSRNRKFAQRFEPNLPPPFTVTNARFFLPNVSYAGYFDYLGITKEIDGLPDTTSYVILEPNPTLPGPNNWASYDLNCGLNGSDPLWLVLHWADDPALGPFVGADNTGPIERQSYWYSDNSPTGWNQWLFNDWMMRMTLRLGTGVESEIVSGLPTKIALGQNYPNPFNPTTSIRFALPNPTSVKITVFNVLGQEIRALADGHYDAGYHMVTWDGRTDDGVGVPSGVYYYRLDAGNHRISKKMTVLK